MAGLRCRPPTGGGCDVRAMIEIEWMDGLVTKVPEFALGDVFGESVQVELDFKFDDVSEGLWVEVRHHKPDEGSDGDPRERACTLHADCHYGLVDAVDLDRIFCVLFEGQPRICRIAGELVNLSRACAMAQGWRATERCRCAASRGARRGSPGRSARRPLPPVTVHGKSVNWERGGNPGPCSYATRPRLLRYCIGLI